ncbi:MAG: hypothetical protein GC159_24295 [Phycisphaera sp.]|nr:hypothetical protein [Phycisphaera sp.]
MSIKPAARHATRRLALIAFAGLIAATATGCDSMQSMLNNMDKPSLSVEGVGLTDLTLDGADLVFDVRVSNPYAVALPLVNADYTLLSGDRMLMRGAADVAGSVPAHGSQVVKMPVSVKFADLLAVATNIKPGGVLPYNAAITFAVNAPANQQLRLPVQKEGKLPIPTVPQVSVNSIAWKDLSLSNAEANIELAIQNTNSFPVDLNTFSYQLKLSDRTIVQSTLTSSTKFGEGQTQTLSIPISFKPTDLGLAAFNMLRGKGANYDISGNMQLVTPYAPINMPYSKSGSTSFSH